MDVIMQGEQSDTSIKIADFGFAKRVSKPNSLHTFCGTPNYVAPEVVNFQPYDERVDNWSAGVILYVLLSGYTPFEGTPSELFRIIPTGQYKFHPEHWDRISPSAKELVGSLLTKEPSKRITAAEVLESDWMTADEETLTATDLSSAQERIRNRMPVEKLRGVVKMVSFNQGRVTVLDGSTLTNCSTGHSREQASITGSLEGLARPFVAQRCCCKSCHKFIFVRRLLLISNDRMEWRPLTRRRKVAMKKGSMRFTSWEKR